MSKKEICLCAGCYEMMFEGDDIVQCPIYKMGELDYIELAHRACIPQWAEFDNWEPSEWDLDVEYDAAMKEADENYDWRDSLSFSEWLEEREEDLDTPAPEPRQAVRLKTRHASEVGYAKTGRKRLLQRGEMPDTDRMKRVRKAAARGERQAARAQAREILNEARLS